MDIEYDLKAIGARIKELRLNMKLTQEQTADLLNFGWNHYSHVESGMSKGSLDFYCKAAKLFGVSVDYLLFDTTGKNTTRYQDIVQHNMSALSTQQQTVIADLVLSIMRNLNTDTAGETDE